MTNTENWVEAVSRELGLKAPVDVPALLTWPKSRHTKWNDPRPR